MEIRVHLIDDDVAVVPGNDGRHDEGDGALSGDPFLASFDANV